MMSHDPKRGSTSERREGRGENTFESFKHWRNLVFKSTDINISEGSEVA